MQYFECECTPLNYRSGTGFERLTHPAGHIIGFGLVALYPMTTLVFFYKKRNPDTKQAATCKNGTSSNEITSSKARNNDIFILQCLANL